MRYVFLKCAETQLSENVYFAISTSCIIFFQIFLQFVQFSGSLAP